MPGRTPMLVEGLAVFRLGDGPPLLLMPNPQGMVAASSSAGTLAALLVGRGHGVITFDPPGAFGSSALEPALDLAEMVSCSEQALTTAGVTEPVPVVGHSQAALAALALALEHAPAVSRLVLVGAVEGGVAATRRAGGMPFGWSWLDPDLWRFAWLGAKLSFGRGSLADHKRLRRLFLRRSYANSQLVPETVVSDADRHSPAPTRAGWQRAIRSVDLRQRLPEIHMPTLVCVGRHDPQTPVESNRYIAQAVADGRLVVFENSGHYPFEEEPELFAQVVDDFLLSPHSARGPDSR